MTAARTFPTPTLVVSQCLGFATVRYDGRIIHDPLVRRLTTACRIVTVCPEVAIGLGVPRPPIHLVRRPDGPPLVLQPRTGRDVTAALRDFGDRFLDALPPVDGFVLKSRSPSCGIRDVGIYGPGPDSLPIARGAGAFGRRVLERFPAAAIDDEERLHDDAPRERFLTLLFALARLRAIAASGRRDALLEFHARYRSVLATYDPPCMPELDRIVEDAAPRPWNETMRLYRDRFARALRHPAPLEAHLRTLSDAFDQARPQLATTVRRAIRHRLLALHARRIPLSTSLASLRPLLLTAPAPPHHTAYLTPYPTPLTTRTPTPAPNP